MRKQQNASLWAFLCIASLIFSAVAAFSGTNLVPISRANLCVTEGALEELPGQNLAVNVQKMRAYLTTLTPQLVEARFTYLGSTGNEKRLGSGELRRQFGLKLRAADACNLVYAMWRIEPESKLAVSVKITLASTPARRAAIAVTAISSRATARPCPRFVPETRILFAPK